MVFHSNGSIMTCLAEKGGRDYTPNTVNMNKWQRRECINLNKTSFSCENECLLPFSSHRFGCWCVVANECDQRQHIAWEIQMNRSCPVQNNLFISLDLFTCAHHLGKSWFGADSLHY